MTLDIAMGGSTNTILHLLATAQEAASTSPWPTSTASRAPCRSTMPQGGAQHRQVPHRGRAPRRRHHGHPGRARTARKLTHRRAHGACVTLGEAPWTWDVPQAGEAVRHCSTGRPWRRARPGRLQPGRRWPSLDLDRAGGCIRSIDHAFSGMAAWRCCAATSRADGCVVKTAGVDDILLVFGPGPWSRARTRRWRTSWATEVKAGDVVVIVRYEGPKGGPACRRCSTRPATSSKGLGKACALLTDGRFSGGTSGLSIGHVLARGSGGSAIGLVQDGDRITSTFPTAASTCWWPTTCWPAARRAGRQGLEAAQSRPRKVSAALRPTPCW